MYDNPDPYAEEEDDSSAGVWLSIGDLMSGLMFFFALGAIAAPTVASGLINWFGPAALFVALQVRGLICQELSKVPFMMGTASPAT